MKVYDGSSWIAATSAGATSLLRFRYVATSGQTTFTGADAASATLSYTVNNIAVHRNGVTLDTSEYTASNGTSIVLAVAAGTGDIIDIIAFKSFTVSDALSALTGGTVSGPVAITGVTTVQAGSASLPAITTTGDTNTGIFFPAADTIAFAEGGVEAMRIDSSGNLGISITSPAWTSTYKAIDVTSRTSFVGTTTGLSIFANNAYFNGTNWIYRVTDAASRYQQDTSMHKWFTAASGTAGNAISFTQAMTLDAAGQLGIGTTSANAILHAQGATTTDGSIKFNQQLNSTGAYNSSPQSGSQVALKYNAGGDFAGMGGWSIGKENATDGNYSSYFAMHNRANGGAITEQARINSLGALLVGVTGGIGAEKFNVTGSVAGFFARLINSNANPAGQVISYSGAAPNGTTNEFYYAADTGTARFYVRSNGGISNYSANNTNLSDRREKTNFAPAKSYLDVICAIPVQTYNYIDQNMEEDGGLNLGVVAQDVQAVAPELVTESDWSAEKDGSKMRLSIYQTDMQYALMKCIQEQQAIIESLTQRITALEGA